MRDAIDATLAPATSLGNKVGVAVRGAIPTVDTEKAPDHLGDGIMQGLARFGSHMYTGTERMWRTPLEGHERDGALGAVKGAGVGLLLFAAGVGKGACDLLSSTLEGLRRTPSMVVDVSLDPPPLAKADRTLRRPPLNAAQRGRKEPGHVMDGVVIGALELGQGLGSGMYTLGTESLSAIAKRDLAELVYGTGMGVVGLGAKASTGVFDCAASFISGVRNTPDSLGDTVASLAARGLLADSHYDAVMYLDSINNASASSQSEAGLQECNPQADIPLFVEGYQLTIHQRRNSLLDLAAEFAVGGGGAAPEGSVDVNDLRIVAVVGARGSGKTSLINDLFDEHLPFGKSRSTTGLGLLHVHARRLLIMDTGAGFGEADDEAGSCKDEDAILTELAMAVADCTLLVLDDAGPPDPKQVERLRRYGRCPIIVHNLRRATGMFTEVRETFRARSVACTGSSLGASVMPAAAAEDAESDNPVVASASAGAPQWLSLPHLEWNEAEDMCDDTWHVFHIGYASNSSIAGISYNESGRNRILELLDQVLLRRQTPQHLLERVANWLSARVGCASSSGSVSLSSYCSHSAPFSNPAGAASEKDMLAEWQWATGRGPGARVPRDGASAREFFKAPKEAGIAIYDSLCFSLSGNDVYDFVGYLDMCPDTTSRGYHLLDGVGDSAPAPQHKLTTSAATFSPPLPRISDRNLEIGGRVRTVEFEVPGILRKDIVFQRWGQGYVVNMTRFSRSTEDSGSVGGVIGEFSFDLSFGGSEGLWELDRGPHAVTLEHGLLRVRMRQDAHNSL